MSRKTVINVHLFLAALFIPAILLTAISGGLYLIGVRGDVSKEVIYTTESTLIDPESENVEEQLHDFFKSRQIDYQFDYVVGNSKSLVTRPTSRTYYVFSLKEEGLEVTRQTPDLTRSIIELHKGHGPALFKIFQQIMAVGLVLILLSGFYLGVSSKNLRSTTLTISGIGGLVLLVTILI